MKKAEKITPKSPQGESGGSSQSEVGLQLANLIMRYPSQVKLPESQKFGPSNHVQNQRKKRDEKINKFAVFLSEKNSKFSRATPSWPNTKLFLLKWRIFFGRCATFSKFGGLTSRQRYLVKGFSAIKRGNIRHRLQTLAQSGLVFKFESIMEQFCGRLMRPVLRRYRCAVGLIGLMMVIPTSKNSRLSRIKRLKSQIRVEALKIEGKLSKSQTMKDKNNGQSSFLDFRVPRNMYNGRVQGVYLVDKENDYQIRAIDIENKELAKKIKQTELFVGQFMRDIELEMMREEAPTSADYRSKRDPKLIN